MKQQDQPKSESPRDPALRYPREREWRELFRYGQEQSRKMGLKPEDVTRLVEEYRAEVAAARAESH